MESIISDTCTLKKEELYSIEKVLEDKYGNIIRWAIVGIQEDNIIISYSYKL